MSEKWKQFVGKGKVFVTSLTDLSKSFVCHDYGLLTANLNADGFNLPAVCLVHEYLLNIKQVIKI